MKIKKYQSIISYGTGVRGGDNAPLTIAHAHGVGFNMFLFRLYRAIVAL